jgi:hypothetical protein
MIGRPPHRTSPMTRVLLVYYSQAGEAARVASAVADGMRSPAVDLSIETLQPKVPYPFPWKSPARFFGVLPECHFGPLPALVPVTFDTTRRFDLVILIYQVWFLAPSLPVQSFLKSDAARVLRDTKVVTFSVSRNMWPSASETMKQLLRNAGAKHVDNVVITHQGPAWATFVSTPRALLLGKKDALGGVFPAAGVSDASLERAKRLSGLIAAQLAVSSRPEAAPFLRGQGTVDVDHRYLIAERLGWHVFRWWSRAILALGRMGPTFRSIGIYLFIVFLICVILIGIPLTMVVRVLLGPLIQRRMARYTRTLQQPSES